MSRNWLLVLLFNDFPYFSMASKSKLRRNAGGSDMYVRDIVCPDGCVMFRLAAKRLFSVKNPFISKAFQ